MSYETAEILDSAADAIERDGWTQGKWGNEDGQPSCATGAIGKAVRAAHKGFVNRTPFSMAFGRFLITEKGLDCPVELAHGGVLMWNDASGRTQQEVLDALRLAAKNERAAEDQP